MIRFDLRSVRDRINADPEFQRRGLGWSTRLRLDMEAAAYDLVIAEGQVTAFDPATADTPSIRIAGPAAGWQKMLSRTPPPHFHTLRTAAKNGFTVEAGDQEQFLAYYGALLRIVALLRVEVSGPPAVLPAGTPFRATDTAVGRYVYVTIEGTDYRIYYEEAGQGVPLLLQHTAGADSRQWRHVLADPDLQRHFRMIAFDLPFHGRSLPPTDGTEWWAQTYTLGKDWLMHCILAISEALALDRPVFMGCSVGGQAATDLAADHPEAIRAAVALNCYYHQDALKADPRMKEDFLAHPKSSQDGIGSIMAGITSPLAPEPFRRESFWVYASQAPGIYKGDLRYFVQEHDLRVNGHRIDTSLTPLYIVAGEYDGSTAHEAGGAAIPAHVKGARYSVIPGVGHFAPTEDPMRFREHIIPILYEIIGVEGEAQAAG